MVGPVSTFRWTWEWAVSAYDEEPEVADTIARLGLYVGPHNLMRNEDVWSRDPQEAILAAAYPLALWFASSWWRLHWEPLPPDRMSPTVEWRMAHELAAAGHGFVWPRVLFAADGQRMRVWAVASRPDARQSLRYLTSLEQPVYVSLDDFGRGIEALIGATLERLEARGRPKNDLQALWGLVCEDRANAESTVYRRVEAEFGFEPDEAPEPFMDTALRLRQVLGLSLSEVAAVYGKGTGGPMEIEALIQAPGVPGKPSDPRPAGSISAWAYGSARPWEEAVQAARSVRTALGNTEDPLDEGVLYDLLGITADGMASWSAPAQRTKAVLAKPLSQGQYQFVPRRGHPTSQRFDLARLYSDYLLPEAARGPWLASSDLGTARQQYQKAFAAELLCPIRALTAFLENDYSDGAIEEAAGHFGVSPLAAKALLANNGILGRDVSEEHARQSRHYPI